MPHQARRRHVAAHPVHLTLRAVAAVRCLRSGWVFPVVRRALAASSRADFRILEFSVPDDHVHLIAEAEHGRALSGGVRGLAFRLARAVNRALGRRGRIWDGHARALTTPRAVRHHPRAINSPYTFLVIAGLMAFIIASFISRDDSTPDRALVLLNEAHHTYVAPPCMRAPRGRTVTAAEARRLGYNPDPSCRDVWVALSRTHGPLSVRSLKILGSFGRFVTDGTPTVHGIGDLRPFTIPE